MIVGPDGAVREDSVFEGRRRYRPWVLDRGLAGNGAKVAAPKVEADGRAVGVDALDRRSVWSEECRTGGDAAVRDVKSIELSLLPDEVGERGCAPEVSLGKEAMPLTARCSREG
jgi:hypothetical protein